MAVFQKNPDSWQRLDLQILQNGWTSLYWKQTILDGDIDWFRTQNFSIVEFDCSEWTNENKIHVDLKKQLRFPDYYGKNLNALNDSLSDLEINETGLVIVFRHFQIADKDLAHSLLDIFADNSRVHILFGEKLLTLVQVDNPNFQINPIGSTAVSWNAAESLNSKRGL
jgi:RNAse (barnase) inhibitor barstar